MIHIDTFKTQYYEMFVSAGVPAMMPPPPPPPNTQTPLTSGPLQWQQPQQQQPIQTQSKKTIYTANSEYSRF